VTSYELQPLKGILARQQEGPFEAADSTLIPRQIDGYVANHGKLHGALQLLTTRPCSPAGRKSVFACVPLENLGADFFDAVAVCTHLGCTPILHLNDARPQCGTRCHRRVSLPVSRLALQSGGAGVKNVETAASSDLPEHNVMSLTSVRDRYPRLNVLAVMPPKRLGRCNVRQRTDADTL
jgi:hypothetical protein